MSVSYSERPGVRAPLPQFRSQEASLRQIAYWLLACCAMIFAMVLIGGITRLTESGLSIVRWDPISGTIPPLTAADWQALFAQYKASPQFRFSNPTMTVSEFSTIFWWEYIHRLWGRLIGFVFIVPLLWFWVRGKLERSLRWPLLGFFALGAVQGAIGWWMVASGLKDVPWVSPYRLTVHLGFALILYGSLLWVALGLLNRAVGVVTTPTRFAGPAKAVVGLVYLTVLAGGFVAGLDAGQIYNEFPLMGDGLIPSDYRDPALSLLANLFENRPAVQFHHRMLAIATGLAVLGFAVAVIRRIEDPTTRVLAGLFGGMVLVQISLGITTLLLHVPVWLGAAHQAGAVALLTFGIILAHRLHAARS